MSTAHSVRFEVAPSAPMQRVHVVIRLALLIALGAIGCSSAYWILYVAVPALAALAISARGAERYLAGDGPKIVRVLHWLASAYAYLWLLTDELPSAEPGGPVELEVGTGGAPTMVSALLRLLYSLPALVLLAVLSIAAGLLWLIGAIAILVSQGVPQAIRDFLAATLRYQFRLVAYHLSLVEQYPSFEHAPLAQLPHSGAA